MNINRNFLRETIRLRSSYSFDLGTQGKTLKPTQRWAKSKGKALKPRQLWAQSKGKALKPRQLWAESKEQTLKPMSLSFKSTEEQAPPESDFFPFEPSALSTRTASHACTHGTNTKRNRNQFPDWDQPPNLQYIYIYIYIYIYVCTHINTHTSIYI